MDTDKYIYIKKQKVKLDVQKAHQAYLELVNEIKTEYILELNELKNKKQFTKLKKKELVNIRKQKTIAAKNNFKNQKQIILKDNTMSLDKEQYDQQLTLAVYQEKNIFLKFFNYLKLNQNQKTIYKKIKKDELNNLNKIKSGYNKNNVFEVENFNFYYGQIHSLFDINIKIPRKKVTAFIGPSGCGKSTFLRCLNRTNTGDVHSTGNIYFNDGTNINSKKLNLLTLRTRVGMIFQKPSPFPMSIYENIAYGPKSHGITNKQQLDQIVQEALTSAALWDEVKDKLFASATALSGGQQQRLCIARAIALKPEVLLMDESTSGLDPIATAKIENLINNLKKNYTIILVSHSMAQVQRVSDYTAFFYKGNLVEFGQTRQIFVNPRNKKTLDYILGKVG